MASQPHQHSFLALDPHGFHSKRMRKSGPRAQVIDIEGVGHAPWLMSEDQITIVRDFLLSQDDNRAGGSSSSANNCNVSPELRDDPASHGLKWRRNTFGLYA